MGDDFAQVVTKIGKSDDKPWDFGGYFQTNPNKSQQIIFDREKISMTIFQFWDFWLRHIIKFAFKGFSTHSSINSISEAILYQYLGGMEGAYNTELGGVM